MKLKKSGEIWKDIPFATSYQVSNFGRVFSKRRLNSIGVKVPEKILKLQNTEFGYLYCHLSLNNKSKGFFVHRLVAETFIAPFKKGMQVNHKDGNKKNNKLENLEWVTAKANTLHAHKIGLITQRGSKNNASKLTEPDVIKIRKLIGVLTHLEISKMFNVSRPHITLIASGRIWKHV